MTAPLPSRCALAVLSVAVVSLCGCGELLGAGDYRVGPGREPDATTDGTPTRDAASGSEGSGMAEEAGADLRRAALAFGSGGDAVCEQCLTTECNDEIRSLLENNDPNCPEDLNMVTCAAERPVSPSAELVCGLCLPGEAPELPLACLACPLAKLGNCEATKCPDCPFGRMFDCSGAFQWPAPEEAYFPVDVWLSGAPAGAEVQFCKRHRDREPYDGDCEDPIGAPAWIDAREVARLTMIAEGAPPLGLSASDAYLLVRETPTTWPQRIYFNRPWSRPTRDAFGFVWSKLPDGGTPPAEVSGFVIDCRGAANFARGVRVELSRADGLATGEVGYGPSGLDSDVTTNDGIFTFRGVEGTGHQDGTPTIATVRVTDPTSGKVIVAGFDFPLRPGTIQQLRLWPDATNFP